MAKEARSLRRQLLYNLALIVIPTLLLGTGAAYLFAVRGTTTAYDLTLLDDAHDIAEQLRNVDGRLSLELSPLVRNILLRNNEDAFTYAAWCPATGWATGDDRLLARAQSLGLGSRQHRFADFGDGRRLVLLSRRFDGRQVLVAVAATTHQIAAVKRSVLESMLFLGGLLVLMAAVGVAFGVLRGLRPVERLRRAITERSPLDLRPLPEAMAPLELRPIVHSVNGLMHELEISIDAHRRFIADAAHQLRTPLAVLHSQVELASRQLAQGTPSDQAELLQKLLRSTRAISRLAGQLLSLARLDHRAGEAAFAEPCDLEAIVRTVAADFIDEASERGIEFAFSLQPCTLPGSAVLLQELFKNLFDNAVHYVGTGGAVEVLMRVNRDRVEIRVLDNGPGVAPKALSRLGTRFFREHPSRSEGCGLGLAIVAEIVGLHGGSIHFTNRPQGGLAVAIDLPLLRQVQGHHRS